MWLSNLFRRKTQDAVNPDLSANAEPDDLTLTQRQLMILKEREDIEIWLKKNPPKLKENDKCGLWVVVRDLKKHYYFAHFYWCVNTLTGETKEFNETPLMAIKIASETK